MPSVSGAKRSSSGSPKSPQSSAKRAKTAGTDVAVFLFRRDLRLYDNTALHSLCVEAAAAQLPVLPLFFFNPLQCEAARNPYFGDACFQFLCESLVDLDSPGQLHGRLVCLRGSDAECLAQVAGCGLDVKLLGYNPDFTPFAAVRDQQLEAWCAGAGVETVTSEGDYTLLPPTVVENAIGHPYAVFTAFYNRLLADHAGSIPQLLTAPDAIRSGVFLDGCKPRLRRRCIDPAGMFTAVPQLALHGGRTEGLALLAQVPAMKKYTDVRDDIPGDKTTHLAPHLKFGTVSVREVWHKAVAALGQSHGFPRQLVWREFYAMLVATHPRLVGGQLKAFSDYKPGPSNNKLAKVVAVNQPFMAKYLTYKWKWSEAEFTRFKAGQTGVPLVDAAVHCLTATGWCHNRTRMVIANFLVKVLGIDWREGERWFATVSVDFDVANNSGGWLWSSGQGADAQPYFRTFNPFRQSARFDPDAAFIHAWVPELKDVPPSVIHKWDEYCEKTGHGTAAKKPKKAKEAAARKRNAKESVQYRTSYPPPMVNIRDRTQKVIAEFKKYDPKK